MNRLLQSVSVVLLLMIGAKGEALEPDAQLSQLGHTAWRIRDGAFNGAVNGVTQTADGYLWIATDNGLLKYDGVRFLPMGSGQILALEAAADGSLWFGTAQSLLHMDHDQVNKLEGPTVHVNNIRQDPQGTIWFTRSRIDAMNSGALCEVVKKKIHCLSAAEGVTLPYAEALTIDAKGDLWVASSSALLRGRPGVFQSYPHSELDPAATSNGIQSLTPRADGSMLVGITRTGPGLGLQILQNGAWHAFSVQAKSSNWSVTATLVDRDGTVWIGTADQGLFRVRDNGIDHFAETDGLSGNAVSSLFEDREGDVWVGTKKGLDRFRNLFVRTFSTTEGLGSDSVHSVTPADNGGVWIGNKGSLSLLKNGKLLNYVRKDGLPGERVTSLLEDHAKRLWVGVDADLFLFSEGRFKRILDGRGRSSGVVVSVVEDRERNIWVMASGRPYVLFRYSAASQSLQQEPLPASPDAIAVDPSGGIFIDNGKFDRPLVHYQQGTLETWMSKNLVRRSSFAFSTDGSRWASTSQGIELFNQTKSRFLDTANGLPCDLMFSLLFDQSDSLWAYSSCGLILIPNEELARFKDDSEYIVKPRLFDVFDGAIPNAPDFAPRGARSTDGRLWFANGTDVQVVDPRHVPPTPTPPAVQITTIVARHVERPAVSGLRLPPLTQDVDLRYTAPALDVPEHLRFRYRLDGHDQDWQDATKLREAFYTDLRPGNYKFRVVSCDAENSWSQRESTFAFTILPAWYQTKTVLAVCLAFGLLIIVLVYRLRIQQVKRESQARYDERLAERTRIARDIHDTLLQTIQGSKLLADTALSQLSEQDQVKPRVQMLSTWLGNAVEEGRTALRSLRTPVIEQQSLENLLQSGLEDCAMSSKFATSFQVIGEPALMSAWVREEIYRIAHEAINNACLHSGGSHLNIVLNYGELLELRIKDDGTGIGWELVQEGRAGHYGLAGMRERTRFLNANLAFVSTPGLGTEVVVRIPRSGLMEEASPSIWARFIRLIRGE